MNKNAIFNLEYIFIIIISGIFYVSCDNTISEDNNDYGISYSASIEAESFLDTLQYRSFLYFMNEINHETGLVKDRSTKDSPASTAAVGWAIPVWAIGAEKGWITREKAKELTLNTLRFFYNSEQSLNPLATGYKGFYYHFIGMEKGERYWNCELSSIDTGWLIAGMRFAGQYYSQDDENEKEIRKLVDILTYRVEWDWFTIPDSVERFGGSMSMSWKPEKGLKHWGWTGLNEGLFLYILAAGSGSKDAVKAYDVWLKDYKYEEPYPNLKHVTFGPLFGHQYSQMFVDFRGLVDKFMIDKDLDYFENSRRALLTQRLYAMENPENFVGYDSLTWGLSACDGPGRTYSLRGKPMNGYRARGTTGFKDWTDDDGTITPTATGGAIVFAPNIVIPTLKNMYEKYGSKGLWGKYGFKDAFNPTVNWYDTDYLGLDQGPIIMMIENLRTGFIWKYMMNDPLIIKGLHSLGFTEIN